MKKSIIFCAFILIITVAFGCAQKTQEVSMPADESVTEETPVVAAEKMTSSTEQVQEQPQIVAKDVAVSSASSQEVSMGQNPQVFERPTDEQVQKALKSAGLYSGAIDGILGEKTKKAIEDFQKQNNLKVDGKVGPQTWSKLKTYMSGPSDNSSSN